MIQYFWVGECLGKYYYLSSDGLRELMDLKPFILRCSKTSLLYFFQCWRCKHTSFVIILFALYCLQLWRQWQFWVFLQFYRGIFKIYHVIFKGVPKRYHGLLWEGRGVQKYLEKLSPILWMTPKHIFLIMIHITVWLKKNSFLHH